MFGYFLFPVEKNTEYKDFTFEEYGKALKSVKSNNAAARGNIDSNVKIKG